MISENKKEDLGFMKKMNKLQALALSTIMIVNMTGTAFANQAAGPGVGPGAVLGVQEGDIVVLYTNDVHTHVDNDGLRYSNVAALKDDLASAGANVLLVDAGDHVQGYCIWLHGQRCNNHQINERSRL